ncbi:phosphate butyryltransferase [Chryseomicrobium excrementi]|uniref:Phosphate butyryltransferase n=1 Tax=Chryseomicrobium excrementi TaxID=2041346 RepID=A0A2M9F2C2_9BACL|nr:bifunctional enoyl-CoA hydratase/phosphate acetyltransferase [Chryseomicrobium excrementi]PJK17618.1 phosphate butyryltransferase [Chryseomicrobium excrementi]
MKTFDDLLKQSAERDKKTIAIACAADKEVLEAVSQALNHQLAKFILFDTEEAFTSFSELVPQHADVEVRYSTSAQLAVREAVQAAGTGQADALMKGHVDTAALLREVLRDDNGLKTGKTISHVAVFEFPDFDRLLFVTDAAMNIAPDVKQKKDIIVNAVAVAHRIGINHPIVSPLSAVEVVNPAMTSSTDAALLTMMNQRGQLTGCTVEGPLAFDNAISVASAKAKGIESKAAGHADILVVPNIEAGNILYKSFMYFAHAKVGAVIEGAKVPIVLTSRADSAESKLYSIALAAY